MASCHKWTPYEQVLYVYSPYDSLTISYNKITNPRNDSFDKYQEMIVPNIEGIYQYSNTIWEDYAHNAEVYEYIPDRDDFKIRRISGDGPYYVFYFNTINVNGQELSIFENFTNYYAQKSNFSFEDIIAAIVEQEPDYVVIYDDSNEHQIKGSEYVADNRMLGIPKVVIK